MELIHPPNNFTTNHEEGDREWITKEPLIKAFDNMIKYYWDNVSNTECRQLKENLERFFGDIPEIKGRCKDPYWKENGD